MVWCQCAVSGVSCRASRGARHLRYAGMAEAFRGRPRRTAWATPCHTGGLCGGASGITPRLTPCRVSGPTQGFRFGGHQGIFRRCGTATRRRAAIPPAHLTSGMHEATMLHPIAVHHGMPCEAGALWRGLLPSHPRGHALGAKKGPVKQGLKTLGMGRMMGLEPTATWATTRCSTC